MTSKQSLYLKCLDIMIERLPGHWMRGAFIKNREDPRKIEGTSFCLMGILIAAEYEVLTGRPLLSVEQFYARKKHKEGYTLMTTFAVDMVNIIRKAIYKKYGLEHGVTVYNDSVARNEAEVIDLLKQIREEIRNA